MDVYYRIVLCVIPRACIADVACVCCPRHHVDDATSAAAAAEYAYDGLTCTSSGAWSV